MKEEDVRTFVIILLMGIVVTPIGVGLMFGSVGGALAMFGVECILVALLYAFACGITD